uniref:Uncharacterized protein n=1 Tax=Lutzomyia longipalpis TaxID=7200 RepID=A0A1B0CP19_LUTLO
MAVKKKKSTRSHSLSTLLRTPLLQNCVESDHQSAELSKCHPGLAQKNLQHPPEGQNNAKKPPQWYSTVTLMLTIATKLD